MKELKGKTVLLRGIKESDIDDRYALGKNDEFIYMCGGNRNGTMLYPDRKHWIAWHDSFKENEYAWIIEYNSRCIGSARLHHISETDRSAAYAIGIFDVSLLSKGIGSEVTKLVLEYAFKEMKLHRIDLKVLDYNKRAIRCYEKCGFKVDGILRDSAYIEGAYYSDVIMSILEDEWERNEGREVGLVES